MGLFEESAYQPIVFWIQLKNEWAIFFSPSKSVGKSNSDCCRGTLLSSPTAHSKHSLNNFRFSHLFREKLGNSVQNLINVSIKRDSFQPYMYSIIYLINTKFLVEILIFIDVNKHIWMLLGFLKRLKIDPFTLERTCCPRFNGYFI